MIDIFASYTSHRYLDVVNPSQATLGKMVGDYNNFNEFMRSMVVIYYQLEERELIGDDQFFRVTLANFITECLFDKEEFNTCVVQVIKNSCKEATDRIGFNMQKFSSFSIHDYDVDEKFSLDANTLKHFGLSSSKPTSKPYTGAIQMVREVGKVRTPA